MGKMQKTALQKKKGARKKKNEGRPKGAMKNPPFKKKRALKKKMKGRALQKQGQKKGALHSNKPNSINNSEYLGHF